VFGCYNCDMKKRLFVFIGKPGVGKTTLMRKLFLGDQIVNVLPYVKAYEIDGKVPEGKTLDGYKDMYKALQKIEKDLLVVEFGANHEEFNVKELEKLSAKYDITIFLCDAPVNICRERARKREREFDEKALEKRLQKDFPNIYLQALKNSELKYEVLNMEKDIEENVNYLKTYGQNNF